MTDAKISVSVGSISFEAEGNQDWISDQLDKLYSKAVDLSTIAPGSASKDVSSDAMYGQKKPSIAAEGKTLASFLKDKNANSKQVLKFLATAVWLESKGKNRMTTSDITQALRDSNQSKLNNAADCLGQNIRKGFCEKDGNQFFVTSEGKESF